MRFELGAISFAAGLFQLRAADTEIRFGFFECGRGRSFASFGRIEFVFRYRIALGQASITLVLSLGKIQFGFGAPDLGDGIFLSRFCRTDGCLGFGLRTYVEKRRIAGLDARNDRFPGGDRVADFKHDTTHPSRHR